jgi:hypothetical protein
LGPAGPDQPYEALILGLNAWPGWGREGNGGRTQGPGLGESGLVPLLAASGVKRFALVTAGSGLGKATVEDVIERADSKGLLMRHFDSIPAARTWLAEISVVHA